jgi:hypothetical protein
MSANSTIPTKKRLRRRYVAFIALALTTLAAAAVLYWRGETRLALATSALSLVCVVGALISVYHLRTRCQTGDDRPAHRRLR